MIAFFQLKKNSFYSIIEFKRGRFCLLFFCEICNKDADIHHIVHRYEGGFDIEINYKYVCEKHHRGKYGPHKYLETDIKYKIEMQNKLYKLFPNNFYKFKELALLLNTSINMVKRITRNLKLYKEGYDKNEIILTLMGGRLYSKKDLENIEFEKLLKNIY